MAKRHTVNPIDLQTLFVRLEELVRETISPAKASGMNLVIDTSDAQEGILIGSNCPVKGADIGSQKKIACAHDVVISRLRPYLRQVAYIDTDFAKRHANVSSVFSTEYFVLRSIDSLSIAFLVPYLLSARVQTILAASVEGGHHPRFKDSALMNLVIPDALVKMREQTSQK